LAPTDDSVIGAASLTPAWLTPAGWLSAPLNAEGTSTEGGPAGRLTARRGWRTTPLRAATSCLA
jgi:hypothetical protein